MMRPGLRKNIRGARDLVGLALALASTTGCSIHSYATRALADTFASSGDGYATDDDPDLVRDAVPFALKTMEQVLAEQPDHVGLLTALARGFTEYSYAFVQQEADRVEDKDVTAAEPLRRRTRKLLLRGRDYGLRGLEQGHPGTRAALLSGKPEERQRALAATGKEQVPLLYWTAASWALAVANGKNDMALVGQLPIIEDVMARARELDASWDEGAIWEFYVSYDGSRGVEQGGGAERARADLDKALHLSGNRKLGPLVSFAEGVCVDKQDKAEFTRLIERVLAFDADSDPPHRLANLVAQRRARWLLGRRDELFAD